MNRYLLHCMSPVVAQSGHTETDSYLSAFGVKRTSCDWRRCIDRARMTQSGHCLPGQVEVERGSSNPDSV
jgi:hypothetical protein